MSSPSQEATPGRRPAVAHEPLCLPIGVLSRWHRDCIYSVWRGPECLYVGMSHNGLSRPLESRHRLWRFLREGDELLLTPCVGGDGVDLCLLERVLVVLLRPTLNRTRSRYEIAALSAVIRRAQGVMPDPRVASMASAAQKGRKVKL